MEVERQVQCTRGVMVGNLPWCVHFESDARNYHRVDRVSIYRSYALRNTYLHFHALPVPILVQVNESTYPSSPPFLQASCLHNQKQLLDQILGQTALSMIKYVAQILRILSTLARAYISPAQSKPQEVRLSNMTAAKGQLDYIYLKFKLIKSQRTTAISDAVRTSLGPRGMDKMVCSF